MAWARNTNMDAHWDSVLSTIRGKDLKKQLSASDAVEVVAEWLNEVAPEYEVEECEELAAELKDLRSKIETQTQGKAV